MKFFVVFSLIFLSIFLFVCTIYSRTQRGRLAKSIYRFSFLSFSIIVSYLITIITSNQIVNHIFSTLYFFTFDFLLYELIIIILLMFNSPRLYYSAEKNKPIRYIYFFLLTVDIIVFLINLKTKTVFASEYVFSETRNCMCWKYSFSPFFFIHQLFGLCFVLSVYCEYIRAIAKDKKNRDFFYIFLLILISTYITLNIIFDFLKWTFDYSIIVFGMICILICYINLYQNKRNTMKLMTVVFSETFNSAIFSFDYNHNCIFMNENAYTIFSTHNEQELLLIAQDYLKREWITQSREKALDYIRGDETLIIDGECHYFLVEYQILRDSRKEEICSYLQFTDRTEEIQKLSTEKLKSTHDSLTGLLNRNEFFKQSQKILADNPEINFYMIATNIKNFKFINDVFGSELGDKILVEQAKAFQVGPIIDCVKGRISSDRFAILIQKDFFRPEDAKKSLEKLQNLTRTLNYTIEINLGIYEISNHFENTVSMFDKAIMAAEMETGTYGQLFRFYNTTLMDRLLNESNIINDFPNALKNKEFTFYLQPIIMTRNNAPGKKCVSAEVLIRWNHPIRGLMKSEEFIKILEKNGLIFQLDQYIWENACYLLSVWRKQQLVPEGFILNFNISVNDFYHKNLYTHFVGLVKKYKIPPSCITLEITEDIINQEQENQIEVLNELTKYGFHIVIDNFGKGYSSLNLVKDLRIDGIKIDNRFMNYTDYDTNSNKKREQIILTNFLQLTEKLGIFVIHEKVEKIGEVKAFSTNKYQLLQGFGVANPLSIDEFENCLNKQGNDYGIYF